MSLKFTLETLHAGRARLAIRGLINSVDVIEYTTKVERDGSLGLVFTLPTALERKTRSVLTTLKHCFVDRNGVPVVVVRPPIPCDVRLRMRAVET